MVSWLYQEMELGIVGLTRSGKTTLFNSLTRRKAELHAFAPAALEPNVGVVRVPDSRLDGLQAILKPKRVVSAEVKYVDVALTREKREHLASDLRAYLSTVDAFIHVVRDFTDEAIPHT